MDDMLLLQQQVSSLQSQLAQVVEQLRVLMKTTQASGSTNNGGDELPAPFIHTSKLPQQLQQQPQHQHLKVPPDSTRLPDHSTIHPLTQTTPPQTPPFSLGSLCTSPSPFSASPAAGNPLPPTGKARPGSHAGQLLGNLQMVASPAPPVPVPMAATRVVMHQIVLPSEVDRLGICFGGQVLSWIDVCAGLSAKTLARGPCVTATLDAVHFLRPCRLGSVVIVAAMVNRTFNSSMEVGVRVETEDMRTGVRHHCCSAYLTFVMLQQQQQQLRHTGMRPSTAGGGLQAPPGIGTLCDLSALSRQSSVTTTTAASTVTTPTTLTLTANTSNRGVTTVAIAANTTAVGTAGAAGGVPGATAGATGAVAAAGTPTLLLPRVTPTTPEHTKVHSEAEMRRHKRLAERQRQREDPQLAAQAELCRLTPITHREGGPTLPPAITPPWLPATCTDTERPAYTSDTPSSCTRRSSMGLPQADEELEEKLASALNTQNPNSNNGNSGSIATDGTTSMNKLTGTIQQLALQKQVSECDTPDQSAISFNHRTRSCTPFLGPQNSYTCYGAYQGPRLSVSPNLTVAYMTQSIMPQHANTLGITFGGQVMSWMEQCAYISASRLRSPHLLTAAIDTLTFVRPTRVGDILYVTSQVTAIFGSSLEVQVSVHGEDPQEGVLFGCADGYVTLVTVAAADGPGDVLPGTPVQLPFILAPETEAELLQAQAAVKRRDERLKLRASLAA